MKRSNRSHLPLFESYGKINEAYNLEIISSRRVNKDKLYEIFAFVRTAPECSDITLQDLEDGIVDVEVAIDLDFDEFIDFRVAAENYFLRVTKTQWLDFNGWTGPLFGHWNAFDYDRRSWKEVYFYDSPWARRIQCDNFVNINVLFKYLYPFKEEIDSWYASIDPYSDEWNEVQRAIDEELRDSENRERISKGELKEKLDRITQGRMFDMSKR